MAYNAASLLATPTPDKRFNNALARLRLTAICDRPYIRVRELQEWLRTTNDNTEHSEFHRLLGLVLARKTGWIPFSNLLRLGQNERLDLVFSILYILGLAEHLELFQQLEIIDAKLPLELSALNRKLVSEAHLWNGAEIANKFDCLQWSFAPKIPSMESIWSTKEHIIPINRCEPLRSDDMGQPLQRGGTSSMYLVEILDEFLSDEVKRLIPFSRYSSPNDMLGPVSIQPINAAAR
jgi:hypothetical protein